MPNYKDDVDFSPWSWTGDGRRIYHEGFDNDVVLTVDGDFENDDQRFRFCRDVVRKLDNYERRVPLTEEQMNRMWFDTNGYESIVRAVEKAHGIGVNHD
jgi:hypothetical protein